MKSGPCRGEHPRRRSQPAAVVNGGGVLVTVPDPARFALLELLVAQDGWGSALERGRLLVKRRSPELAARLGARR